MAEPVTAVTMLSPTDHGPLAPDAVGLALDRAGAGEGTGSPEGRDLAEALDANHAPEPGSLRELGTCRRCGLITARDKDEVWRHQPSVEEIDAGEVWLDRHPGTDGAHPESSGPVQTVPNRQDRHNLEENP